MGRGATARLPPRSLVVGAAGGANLADTTGTRAALAAAVAKPYADLMREHLAEHRRLFRRVSLDLGTSAAAQRPTDERVAAYATGGDPQLATLYFQFGAIS